MRWGLVVHAVPLYSVSRVMAHDSFDVDDILFVKLKVLIAGQVRKDVLRFVTLVNLHNQHLLRRYLDVDLVPQISLILPPVFPLRAFGAFTLASRSHA